jgi:hypothetical protein
VIRLKILLCGWLLFVSHSETFAVEGALQIGESQTIGEDGTMVICHYPSEEEAPIDVLIHFHGMVSVVADNFTQSKVSGALIVINFNGLSAAYSKPFQNSPALFNSVLDRAFKQLGPKTTWGRISVSSFSAGYGAVREILKTPGSFDRIDALIASDSMYASLEEENEPRRPIKAHMLDYVRFAKLASKGKKTFIITHSNQETPYASTTETANYMLEALSIHRLPTSPRDAEALTLTSKAATGKFTVLGYDGITGQDHLQHLHNIHLWWAQLARAARS